MFRLFIRILLLVFLLLSLVYFSLEQETIVIVLLVGATLYVLFEMYFFVKRRFEIIDDYFQAVKYRDFSRWFPEDRGPKDIRYLYTGFNEVNRTIKEINNKNEAQYVYLQKILEMVDVGIIAYNLDSGNVLWSNESFRDTLDVPAFKNVRFVEKRKPDLFKMVFETHHREPNSISIALQNEKVKILISDTVFQIEEEAFKLIVIQNIDNTLDKNESEAWKKLLSVMTHEIMNSITPISSLADTLQQNLELFLRNPKENELHSEDLYTGIKTIKNRSEGLLKFAKTYRSLNKITHLNLETIRVSHLFESIELLMGPSIKAKNIEVDFSITSPRLTFNVDIHLMEQVMINLILNAIDACKNREHPHIKIKALQAPTKDIVIKVYDNGSGIPQDIMEQIFIPFFTSKSTGSGIGLSLCKQIMLLHKGKISVNSIEAEGTVISLIF